MNDMVRLRQLIGKVWTNAESPPTIYVDRALFRYIERYAIAPQAHHVSHSPPTLLYIGCRIVEAPVLSRTTNRRKKQ